MGKIEVHNLIKRYVTFFLIVSSLFTVSVSFGQNNKISPDPGGRFDFGKYQFSTKNLYKDIPQDNIKAVRLSVRQISKSDPKSSFLFYPQKRSGNQISLMDLLLWAIREKGLPCYDSFMEPLFEHPLSMSDLDSLIKRKTYYGDTLNIIDLSQPSDFLIFEVSVYGKDGKVIAVRPIALAPVSTDSTSYGSDSSVRRYLLFKVYFPDIMNMLSQYYPAKKVKGLKSGLDLFVKNLYGGSDISGTFFGDFINLLSFTGDTNIVRHDFDTAWLSKKIKNGIFINPANPMITGASVPVPAGKIAITEESYDLPPDLSCSRITQKLISLRDTSNYPIYFPLEKAYGNKSLSDLILEGLKSGRFMAFEYFSDTPLSVPLTYNEIDKLMSETIMVTVLSEDNNNMIDKIMRSEYPTSDIRYYYIKEAEFFDRTNKYIGSRIISISPVLERTQPEIMRVIRRPLFEIPFNDASFRSVLAQNNITQFGPEAQMSFLSFFNEKKYRVEKAETLPATIGEVRRELGLQPVPPSRNILSDNILKIAGIKTARLVTREITKKDTANYQLFYPEYQHYGIITFFDLIRDALLIQKMRAWYYAQNETITGMLSYDYISGSLSPESALQIMDMEGNPKDTVIKRITQTDEIESYLIRELVTDSITIPIAICPVHGNQYSEAYVNMFWVYFSDQFREIANRQEILRLNCEAERSFADFLAARKYKGNIVNEKALTPAEISQIVQNLK